MRKNEIVKGLRLIAEGFTTLANAYEIEETVTEVKVETPIQEEMVEVLEETKVEEPKVEEPTEEVVEEPVEETIEEVEEVVEEPKATTEEELKKLSYNDIKVRAKEVGVKAVGSKQTLIENILNALNVVEEVVEETKEEIEEVVEEAIEEVDADSIDEEELEDAEIVDNGEEHLEDEIISEDMEIEEEDEEEESSLYDSVVADLEGYTDEELADILSDIGVSPKGKRQALLAKIVQAIEDGKLEWEEDEAEEVEESKPLEDEEETTEMYVETGLRNESTKARKMACSEEIETIKYNYEQGNISHKEIIKYLKAYHNDGYVSQGEDADLQEYIDIQCNLIDDEGEKHDLEDPYYIGDDVCCCGIPLKQLQDDYFCEICGNEYEV